MHEKTQRSAGENIKRILVPLLLGLALSFAVFLALTTVYSSDDYWYSTFMDDGLSTYLRLMKEHYLTFNGRVVVHVFAHAILHFGNLAFAVAFIAIIVLIPIALYHAMEGGKAEPGRLLPCVLLFACGLLALPRSVMVNGVLWISAFCNYALSTGMLFLEIALFSRLSRRDGRLPVVSVLLLGLLCFLCGATTEQMGLAAVAVSGLFTLLWMLHRNKRFFTGLVGMVCGLCGVLTIFFSPATRQRLVSESAAGVETNFIVQIKQQLNAQAAFFSDSVLLLALLAFLLIYTGCMLWRTQKTRVLPSVWFLASTGCLTLLGFAGGGLRARAYVLLLGLLLLQSALWLWRDREAMAMAMFAGLTSLAAMLFTNTNGERTYLPFCLCALAVSAYVLTQVLAKLPSGKGYYLALSSLSLLSFLVISLQLPGYWYNYRLDRMNRQSAAQAEALGVVYYSIDYDMSYTHIKAYSDGYFYRKWLDAEGIDPEATDVYFYSEMLPTVYMNGIRASSPALIGKSGDWLLPLRDCMDAFGGTLELNSPNGNDMTLYFGDTAYHCVSTDSDMVIQWQAPNGETHTTHGERSFGYFMTCISERFFTELFGLSSTHRDGCIYIN